MLLMDVINEAFELERYSGGRISQVLTLKELKLDNYYPLKRTLEIMEQL
jgi:hypothetical protein